MWKQLKSFKHPEGVFSVGMSRKKTDTEVSFRVTIRRGEIKHTEAFIERDRAELLFARLVREGADVVITQEHSTAVRLEDAAFVRANPKAKGLFKHDIWLLLALDRVTSKEVAHNHGHFREKVGAVLDEAGLAELPAPNDFDAWLIQCIDAISNTRSKGSGKFSANTLRHKLGFFRRAVRQIVNYRHFFGREIAAEAASSLARLEQEKKVALQKSVAQVSRKALSVAEIRNELSSLETPKDKIWFLKSLACGLRPAEVLRLSREHIVDGRVNMAEVVTKTASQTRPNACTALKILLEAETKFPAAAPERRLENGTERYQLRTTCATHLCYSGADHNSVAEILGHTTATMALRVYARSRPPGATDDRSAYYSNPAVRMDGSELAKNEPIYFRWLLKLTVDLLISLPEIGLAGTRTIVRSVTQVTHSNEVPVQNVVDL